MFLVDDVLLAPVKGLEFLARQIQEAAGRELGDHDSLRQELRELYMELETGRITEEEFERREAPLVERLEALDAAEAEPDRGSARPV